MNTKHKIPEGFDPCTIKNICAPHVWRKIRALAYQSFFRLNAVNADCYAFTMEGRDWSGGWDWTSRLVDKTAHYILVLETGKVYKNTKLKISSNMTLKS